MANAKQRGGNTAVAEPARTETATKGDSAKNRPAHEVRMGRICGAIWAQESAEGLTWYTVTLSRIYRDSDENWQRSDSFGRTDLPLVAKVADLCHSWIYANGRDKE